MTTNTRPTEAVEAVVFLGDFCATCLRRCGCPRLDTITEPTEIHWPGPGQSITATYECNNGHRWRCRWSPEYLPVHPNPEG